MICVWGCGCGCVVSGGLIRLVVHDHMFAGLACVERRGGNEVVVKTDGRGRSSDSITLRRAFGGDIVKTGNLIRTVLGEMRHFDRA